MYPSMVHLMAINYIRGEYFKSLANNLNIFYCDIHDAVEFFKNPPKNKFILITHNSDGKVTKTPKRFNSGSSNDANLNDITIPNNLIKWYSQNVEIEHEKIESIPIGLENGQWFRDINKEYKIDQTRKKNKEIKNLLYVCYNINTNPAEREEPYLLFRDSSWATVEGGVNGHNFDNYLSNIHSHHFVICPEGNGTDTHRTWETLYVGSIPIEKRNLNNKFYEDLPICFVDKWSEITEEFLNKEYNRIKSNNWNLEKLNFTFWKNKIEKNYI